MRTKNHLFIGLLVALMLLVSGCAGSAIAQSTNNQTNPTPRTINVTGNGKIYLTPDIAYITIGVHTENKDAAEAVLTNNATSKKVADALKTFNIDPKDIKTANFNIYPQQIFDQNGKVEGNLYVVDNSIYITVRDLDKISSILGKVIESGANSISGIQFDVADKSQALSQAREEAVANAQSQAEEICKAAGVTLGKVQNINVYSTYPTANYDARSFSVAEAAASYNVPITPGQLTVSVDVNVTFEIE